MKRKLIAFDVDGTLVVNGNNLLESTIFSIENLQKQGHIVTIATGRSRLLLNNILQKLSLENYIVCNGSAAFINNVQVFDEPLNQKRLIPLSAFLTKNSADLALTGLEEMKLVTSSNKNRVKEVMSCLGGVLPAHIPDFTENYNIYQALGFYSKELDNSFEHLFPEFRFIRWNKDCVDIISKQSSKARTLKILAENLNIDRKDIIAFGDGDNDIEMLEFAEIGIAMGNSSEHAKQAANFITESNKNNGIYNALKKIKLL